MSQETWTIYALGGGFGHLQRALALARQATRQQHVHLLVNSRYWPWVQPHLTALFDPAARANLQVSWRSPDLGRAATRAWIEHSLLTAPGDRLIVDTFPRGLVGELATLLSRLPIPRILVHRDLNPDYVRVQNLRRFVTRCYDQILIPGEGSQVPFADLPTAQLLAPWLLYAAAELPSVAIARSRLGFAHDPRPLAIVLAAGRADELTTYGQLLATLHDHYPQLCWCCLAPNLPPDCPVGACGDHSIQRSLSCQPQRWSSAGEAIIQSTSVKL
ncbi:MAG: hypothetical protein HC838_01015 [Spirulinaceae cyanobacterium RM2_2_10]|nr:hypothetical protein [Spirulinaceae cyanobacterium RM2_2_10]